MDHDVSGCFGTSLAPEWFRATWALRILDSPTSDHQVADFSVVYRRDSGRKIFLNT